MTIARPKVSGPVLGAVIVVGLAGTGFFSYSAGARKAEQRCSVDVRRIGAVQDSLYRIFRRDGKLPRPNIDTYEMHGLTVSDLSDTSVTYYSGLEASHLLTLHIDPDGRLSVSRE